MGEHLIPWLWSQVKDLRRNHRPITYITYYFKSTIEEYWSLVTQDEQVRQQTLRDFRKRLLYPIWTETYMRDMTQNYVLLKLRLGEVIGRLLKHEPSTDTEKRVKRLIKRMPAAGVTLEEVWQSFI